MATGKRTVIQEREETTRTVCVVEHCDDRHFIVNTHTLHHPHIIAAIFPKHLLSLPSIQDDRLVLHQSLAAQLREKKKKKKNEKDVMVRIHDDTAAVTPGIEVDEHGGSTQTKKGKRKVKGTGKEKQKVVPSVDESAMEGIEEDEHFPNSISKSIQVSVTLVPYTQPGTHYYNNLQFHYEYNINT